MYACQSRKIVLNLNNTKIKTCHLLMLTNLMMTMQNELGMPRYHTLLCIFSGIF